MSLHSDQRWSLTREAFEQLLRRLNHEPEAAAREYEAIRRRLIAFFQIRGLLSSEVLADEALDRVARKLDECEPIEHLLAYVYGVAKRLALESMREQGRERAALDTWRALPATDPSAEEAEPRVACLSICLRKLPKESRALILGYYQGEGVSHLEERKLLASWLGIRYGTLKTRAHRVRGQLEECLRQCLEARRVGDR